MNRCMNGTDVAIVYRYDASREKLPASWKTEMVKAGFLELLPFLLLVSNKQ